MFDFSLERILLTIPGIIIGFAFHELAHALVADRLGDPTPRRQGKLTLSPKAHIDPLGLLLIVIMGFGWAKPVETNPSYFKKPKRDDILVAVAGAVGNIFVALMFAVFLKLLFVFGASTNMNESLFMIISRMFTYTIWINIVIALFNLLPIPGLDGFHVLRNIIPLRHYGFIYTMERYSFIILILIIVTPVASYIIGGPATFIYNNILSLLALI